VGRLRLIDFDVVELSNLQRQILYDEGDVGKSKVQCAYTHLRRINSEVTLEPVEDKLTGQNAESLLTGFDVIMDGTDNYQARFVMNDVAKKNGIPLHLVVLLAPMACRKCSFLMKRFVCAT